MMQQFLQMLRQLVDWKGYDRRRVELAAIKTVAQIDVVKLHFLENCVACGACGPACPFFYAEPIFAPTNKAEELRRIYRKKLTIAGMILGPLVAAGLPKSAEKLNEIAVKAYACSNCGNCYPNCPFGIDSGALIMMLRRFLSLSGRVPTILLAFAIMEKTQAYMQIPPLMQFWDAIVSSVKEAIGRDPPMDKKGAEVMLLPFLIDGMFYPRAVGATAKLLDAMGVDWTMPSKPIAVRPPIAALAGLSEDVRDVMSRVHGYIEEMKVNEVVLVDGGFPYPWLRWYLPETLRVRQSYSVKHVHEVILEGVEEEKIRIEPGSERITYHLPCSLGRRGGLVEEPYEVMKMASRNFVPLPNRGENSLCCGGGSSVGCLIREFREMMAKMLGMPPEALVSGPEEEQFLEEIEHVYKIAAKRKVDEIRRVKPEIVLTDCPGCIHSISFSTRLYGVNVKVMHSMEYLADKIKPIH